MQQLESDGLLQDAESAGGDAAMAEAHAPATAAAAAAAAASQQGLPGTAAAPAASAAAAGEAAAGEAGGEGGEGGGAGAQEGEAEQQVLGYLRQEPEWSKVGRVRALGRAHLCAHGTAGCCGC